MAPTLRGQCFHTPSPEPLANREATTTRKCRFFDALSRDGGSKSLRSISKACGIGETTGRDWKKQFENMGSLAKRKTRKRSTKLGRRSKVTKSMCKMLVSPSRNPVRKQPLDTQIAFHDIPVKTRQLQRKLKEHTKEGGRYLCAFIKKEISEKNHKERAQYGDCHIYDPLFGFFDHIVYTDEAHVDPTSQAQGRVLREQGTRDRPENIEERPPLKGVRFHIAAWISWWDKAPKLEFYNDEEDKVERPPMPPKPRRRPTTETKEEWRRRLAEWEALKPHDVEVTVKGNAMTQKYYVERLLPTYVAAIESMREIDDKPWLLQEDGDPSHGMRKAGLARKYKDAHDVQNLVHPAQSPDLNPIEGIWAIIKQRLRRRIFDSEKEIKEALQEEWDRITMKEIRDRIADMPRRCAELVRSNGGPIRGNKW
jgi:transposase